MTGREWTAILAVLAGACATGSAPGMPCDLANPCDEPGMACVDDECVPVAAADGAPLVPEADAGAGELVDAATADAGAGEPGDAAVTSPPDAAPLPDAASPPDAALPPDAAPPPDAVPDPFCGDDSCDSADGETCATCPGDCGDCCGNTTCEPALGETCSTCPADCPALAPPTDLWPSGYTTVTGESVTLQWSPVCGATEYDVLLYYWKVSTSSWEWYYQWNTGNDYFTVWPVLSSDFFFQVRAGNGVDVGSWSAASYFTYSN